MNESGRLCAGGLEVSSLVEKFGSPLFVVNRKKLIQDASEVLNAFKLAIPGSLVLYSYKTNCTPGILRELHSMGIGAEVISPYELWLAERLGVPGDRTVYNGVNKTSESLDRAVKNGVLAINIDSINELERIYASAKKFSTRVNVGVRLGLVNGSQFGLEVDTGEAFEACKRIAGMKDRLNFNCVHFNVTSNSKTSTTHAFFARRALEFVKRISEELGLAAPYLDIGGGFGVATTKNMSGKEYGLYRLFGCLPKPPSPDETEHPGKSLGDIINEIKKITTALKIQTPKLIIEPGRLVTSRSEFLLTRVNAIKEKKSGSKFVITDAGRLSTAFPCDFEYHEVFVADRPEAKLTNRYNVMGRICTSADWLFKNRMLPNLKTGDVLAIMDAGAYFWSYSTNFAFPRPAVIMVEGGNARVLQKAESFEHLVAMDTGCVEQTREVSPALLAGSIEVR